MSAELDSADVGVDETVELVPRRGLTTMLVAIIAAAVVAGAVAAGHLWGASGRSTVSWPSSSSVDAGFARDMSTHHQQAITMAGYTRDNTTDPQIKTIAYDIETSQEFQVGEMQGWLDTWGLSRDDPTPMTWMGHTVGPDGLMPGMATAAQLSQLEASHGQALDILFLQLMIHHHQGGVEMAQYAAQNAASPYVRTLAESMYVAQSNEIVQMSQLLTKLGGTALPAPTD